MKKKTKKKTEPEKVVYETKEYFFCVPEGLSTDIDGRDVRNVYIIGFETGSNLEEAFSKFRQTGALKEYSLDEVFGREVGTDDDYHRLSQFVETDVEG